MLLYGVAITSNGESGEGATVGTGVAAGHEGSGSGVATCEAMDVGFGLGVPDVVGLSAVEAQ
jgi:hypothetical protein